MDAIVISDIHISSLNCQAKILCEFLQELRGKPPKWLVINGDLFDNFSGRLCKHQWQILTILRKISKICKIIYIAGNHDRVIEARNISKLFGGIYLKNHFIFQSSGKKFLIFHGDCYDEFIAKHPWITAIADTVYDFLQKIDKSFYLARAAKTRSKVFLRNAEIIEVGARELMLKLGCDRVICGHSHYPVVAEDGIYANSGSFVDLPCTYIEIDEGEMTLKEFSAKKG